MQDALDGKPVLLRNGEVGYVIFLNFHNHNIIHCYTFLENKILHFECNLAGHIFDKYQTAYDIIGMF